MRRFLLELIFAALASIICVLYILFPEPHLMALFVFVAQPMFIFTILSFSIRMLKGARQKKVS